MMARQGMNFVVGLLSLLFFDGNPGNDTLFTREEDGAFSAKREMAGGGSEGREESLFLVLVTPAHFKSSASHLNLILIGESCFENLVLRILF